MPAFQPYRGKPAVRNDRGDRGDVGIIRSPVRASILPDWGAKASNGCATRQCRTSGSGAARLAAIPAGASPANTRSPVHVVVIPSGREGDQTAESLEVKALWGRGDLVRSVKGGRATWQAVA